MFIRSERLFLRPGWPEDWQEFYTLISDEAVRANLARDPWPQSEEEARAQICAPRDRLLPHLFITLPGKQGTRMLGSIGLGRDGEDVELGYWIASAARGQGFATEAVRAMLSLARALGHERVCATHFTENTTTARVLEKTGFRPTGDVRRRHCPARGESLPAQRFAIVLDCAGTDGDGAGGGEDKRAA
jgi:RimJ/RimL family protein N-acetyltransferase